MKRTNTQTQDNRILFIQLKSQIIGAYGNYAELEPYYLSSQ